MTDPYPLLSNKSSESNLTKYPLGSLREIWSISWPLMIGLLSSHFMIFMDRFFLARHSLHDLNAGANASLAYYAFMVIPLAICAISEVFVGKLQGQNRSFEVGHPVWQMIWFGFLLTPIFVGIAYFFPPLLFYNTGNELRETAYFQTLLSFAPFFCCTVSLNGFFVGIGQVKKVALCTFLANILNICLGYLLILGHGPFPALGAMGAGLATGISQVFQSLILMFLFLTQRHQRLFGTNRLVWDWNGLLHGCKIGAPAGLAHFMEILAHYFFFRILISAGSQCLTLVVLVQSFSMFIAFVIEAQSKGVCAIIANLIGSRNYSSINKVLKSALSLHSLFFLVLITALLINPFSFLNFFLSQDEIQLLQGNDFQLSAIYAIIWMTLFFLFDGFSWIMVGMLTAASDTKFLFYVSAAIHWGFYLSFAYYFIGTLKKGAEIAWMITALCSFLHFSLFFWRYRSGKWLKTEITSSKNI